MTNKHVLKKVEDAPNAVPQDKKRTAVAKELSKFLGTTYVLYQKTLFYHWNVTGVHFYGLHLMMEAQYQELHTAGDEVAERVRALGFTVPGTFREFLELSTIKEDAGLPKNEKEMLNNLLDAHEAASKEARKVADIAEDADDMATSDMMVDRMKVHDKAAWMLRALLTETASH